MTTADLNRVLNDPATRALVDAHIRKGHHAGLSDQNLATAFEVFMGIGFTRAQMRHRRRQKLGLVGRDFLR